MEGQEIAPNGLVIINDRDRVEINDFGRQSMQEDDDGYSSSSELADSDDENDENEKRPVYDFVALANRLRNGYRESQSLTNSNGDDEVDDSAHWPVVQPEDVKLHPWIVKKFCVYFFYFFRFDSFSCNT